MLERLTPDACANQFHSVGSVQDIPGSTTLTMADDANHTRQRRALSHAFSQKALLEQESIIRGYVNLFVDRLRPFSDSHTAINICDWFSGFHRLIPWKNPSNHLRSRLHNVRYHRWHGFRRTVRVSQRRCLPFMGIPHHTDHQGWGVRAGYEANVQDRKSSAEGAC